MSELEQLQQQLAAEREGISGMRQNNMWHGGNREQLAAERGKTTGGASWYDEEMQHLREQLAAAVEALKLVQDAHSSVPLRITRAIAAALAKIGGKHE